MLQVLFFMFFSLVLTYLRCFKTAVPSTLCIMYIAIWERQDALCKSVNYFDGDTASQRKHGVRAGEFHSS